MCINCTDSYEPPRPLKCSAFPKGIPEDKLMFIGHDPCIFCNNGIGYSPNSTVVEPVRSEQKANYDLARKLMTEYERKFGKKYIYPIPTCLPVEVFIDDLLHHLNGEQYNMTNEEIYENIAIARRELEELHLLVPDNEVFLDCFYFPPFSEKTYYAQIVKSESGYSAHIAYTYYADFWGLSSYSQTFKYVYSLEHSAKIGRVISEVINLDEHFVDNLKGIAEQYSSLETDDKGSIVIDGICGGIRLYENGSISRAIIIHNPPTDDSLLNELKKISQKKIIRSRSIPPPNKSPPYRRQ